MEGTTALKEATFSSEGLAVNFSRTADFVRPRKAMATPADAPAAFFLRVRVRQRIGMCTLMSTQLGMFTNGGI